VMLDVPALSRASSLPHWIFSSHNIRVHPGSFCGSEPARDEACPFNIFIDCDTAFASKLAPTLDLQQPQYPYAYRVLLWERACSRRGQYIQHLHRLERRLREQARSHIGSSADTISVCTRSPSVGASLLAKAGLQSMKMVDVLASSRASPTGETRSHQEPGRLLGRLAVDVDLGAPLTTMAERRHCGVGIPAWMPG
jgi:hypothetical protein